MITFDENDRQQWWYPEIERLQAELREQTERAKWAIEKGVAWRDRAEKAEAKLARVSEANWARADRIAELEAEIRGLRSEDGIIRDERGMGWERAHTTLCDKIPCREHRNPWMRSR